MSKATNSDPRTKFICRQFLCLMDRLNRISLQRIIILGYVNLNHFWTYQKLEVLRVREALQVVRTSHLRKSTLNLSCLSNMKKKKKKLNTIQTRKIWGGKKAYSVLWNNQIIYWSTSHVASYKSKTNCKSITKSLIQRTYKWYSLRSKMNAKNWLRAQNSQGLLITTSVKMITSCQKLPKCQR